MCECEHVSVSEMKYAIEKDKPMICMCAGFQALCSMYAKDRTEFDMSKELPNEEHHHVSKYDYVHSISIVKDTLLYNILGKDNIMVSSNHTCYVDHELNDLIPCAYSDDGVLEAVCLNDKKCILGVQFHPESLKDESSKKIIDYFVSKL